MDRPLQRNLAPRALVVPFAATALALIVLAVADTVTPYGWKVFVLAKIFKIGWAASVAFGLALFVPKSLCTTDGSGTSGTHLPAWMVALAAFAAALVASGYLMPDWHLWSELIAGLFPAGWAVIALTIRRASR